MRSCTHCFSSALVLLVLLCVCDFSRANVVQNCNYKDKSGKIGGVDVSLRSFNVEFDQNLYVLDRKHWCHKHTCDPANFTSLACPPCNYASKTDCGNFHNNAIGCAPCAFRESYCASNKDQIDRGEWEELNESEPFERIIPRTAVHYYRFFISEPCAGYKLSLESHGNWITMRTSVTNSYAPTILEGRKMYSQEEFICPEDPLLQQRPRAEYPNATLVTQAYSTIGTYYVSISTVLSTTEGKYKLTLEKIPDEDIDYLKTTRNELDEAKQNCDAVFRNNTEWTQCLSPAVPFTARYIAFGEFEIPTQTTAIYHIPKEHVGCPTFFAFEFNPKLVRSMTWVSLETDYPQNFEWAPDFINNIPRATQFLDRNNTIPWNRWNGGDDAWITSDYSGLQRTVFSFCPKDVTANISVVVKIWPLVDADFFSPFLMADSDPKNFIARPLSQISPLGAGVQALKGTSFLACSGDSARFYSSETTEKYNAGYSPWTPRLPSYGDIHLMQPPIPILTHELRSTPLSSTLLERTFDYTNEFFQDHPLQPNLYNAIAVVDFATPAPFYSVYNSTLTYNLLNNGNCAIRFSKMRGTSRLVNEDLTPAFLDEIPLSTCTPREAVCSSAEFGQIQRRAEELLDLMNNDTTASNDGRSSVAAANQDLEYQLRALSWTDSWVACSDEIDSLLAPPYQTIPFTLPPSPPTCTLPVDPMLHFDIDDRTADNGVYAEWLANTKRYSDPCCNDDVAYSQCCVPPAAEDAMRMGADFVYPTQVDEDSLDASCAASSDSECVATFVQDWVEEIGKQHDPENGCASVLGDFLLEDFLFSSALGYWHDCTDAVFGSDYRGGSSSSSTSKTSEEFEDEFLLCFLENSDPLVVNYIREKYDLEEIKPDKMIAEMRGVDALFPLDCRSTVPNVPFPQKTSGTGNPLELRSHLQFQRADQSCVDDCYLKYQDNIFCLSTECDLPWICVDTLSDTDCRREWVPIQPSQQECLSDSVVCNYDFSIEATADTDCSSVGDSEFFCGMIDAGTELSDPELANETSCVQAKVCILPDGTIDETRTSAAACGVCSEKCRGPRGPIDCATQQDCMESNNAGRCSDAADLFLLSNNAGCVGEHYNQTWRSPPCHPANLPSFSTGEYFYTEYACIRDLPKSRCTSSADPLNPTTSFWREAAKTESECLEFYSQGCLERDPRSPALSQHMVMTRKPADVCQCAGGTPKPFFTWQNVSFTPGELKTPAWQRRGPVTLRRWDRALSFIQLEQDTIEGLRLGYSLLQQTAARCEFQRSLSIMSVFACSCSAVDGNDNSSSSNADCFEATRNIPLGIGRVCPGIQEYSFVAPPHAILFSNDSITEDALERTGACTNVEAFLVEATTFKRPITTKLSATFAHFRQTSEPFEVVVNDDDVVVGKVIGDGVTAVFSQGNVVASVEFCLNLRDDLYNSSFPIFDFGRRHTTDQYKVIPLDVQGMYLKQSGSSTGRQLCGVIGIASNESTVTVIPIEREDDWQEATDGFEYTAVERALLFIAGVLYYLAMLYSGTQMLQSIFARGFTGLGLSNVVHFLLFPFLMIRGIYFLLLSFEKIPRDDVVDYILVELPTFLLFAALLVVISVLVAVLSSSRFGRFKGERIKKYVEVACILVMIAAVLLFVLLVLVFELATEDEGRSGDDESVCDLRVGEDDDGKNWSDRDIVNLVYRLVVALVAVVLALAIGIFGSNLYAKLTLIRRRTNRAGGSSAAKIFSLTAITVLCFLLHALLLLALAITEWTNVVFGVIFLVIIEVIPAVYITYQFHTARTAGQHAGRKTGSSSSRTK